MSRDRPSFQVVLAVVEHEGRYMIIHEASHGQRWYLPAGGVEPNETIAQACVRETREEAGIEVEPIGMLKMEERFQPGRSGGTLYVQRFVLAARPLTFEPKTLADEHSLESRWLTLDEIGKLALRDPEVLSHIRDHQRGAPLPVARDGFRVG